MKQHPESGLTIIELLVAISIFLVIVTFVLAALPNLFQINRRTGTAQTVSIYATSVIEQTRRSWLTKTAPVAPATDAYPLFTAGTLPTTLPAAPAGLSCTAPAVSTQGTATPPGRRRITVTCTPTGFSAISYVAEIGRPE
ncbi:hypothetical protein DESA109040_19735 [Deinococcus saxicola]|uniref:PulJ/GspJ family protein n=1 Tax=Deinococcus saxicola TaxID=249406 RepID=UPI0039EF16E0